MILGLSPNGGYLQMALMGKRSFVSPRFSDVFLMNFSAAFLCNREKHAVHGRELLTSASTSIFVQNK